MELYDAVRDIVRNVVNNMDPTGVCYATVLSADPLRLEIQGSRLQVDEPVAAMTDAVRYRDITVGGQVAVVNPGLAAGDKVLAIKANAGQNYIVISKA